MEGLVSGIAYVLVFGSILFLAYVTTKYVGKKTNVIMKGKHIKVVETVSLGFDSKLYLVKVADEFMLISSSGKNVKMLKTVEINEQGVDVNIIKPNNVNFKDFFQKCLGNFKPKENGKKTKDINENIAKGNLENFKEKKIKRNLKKLKEFDLNLPARKMTENKDEYTNDDKAKLS